MHGKISKKMWNINQIPPKTFVQYKVVNSSQAEGTFQSVEIYFSFNQIKSRRNIFIKSGKYFHQIWEICSNKGHFRPMSWVFLNHSLPHYNLLYFQKEPQKRRNKTKKSKKRGNVIVLMVSLICPQGKPIYSLQVPSFALTVSATRSKSRDKSLIFPSQVARPTWGVGRENKPPESRELFFRGF